MAQLVSLLDPAGRMVVARVVKGAPREAGRPLSIREVRILVTADFATLLPITDAAQLADLSWVVDG